MSLTAVAALLALTLFAIYKQSVRHEFVASQRFKMPLIYAGIGLVAGGFQVPESRDAWVALIGGSVLSAVVGLVRGRYSRMTLEDGKVFNQGTPLTIGLFVTLISAKFAMGAYDAMHHIPGSAGFGEVMVLIALMLAFQAEVTMRRARALVDDGKLTA